MRYDTLPELAAYPARMNCATELLDRAVQRGWADRTALLAPGIRWTYQELLDKANRIAHVLVDDLGVRPGHRVLLRGPNHPMLVACWFAVLKAGGVVVCTMPLLRTRELAFTADKARISLALSDIRIAAECEAAMPDGRVVHYGAPGQAGSLEQLMADKPAAFRNVDTAADDTALIAFTSGTTGQGKGTMHFHRDIMAVCDCFPRYVLKPRADDVFIGSPPLAFTFGLGGLVLFPMRVGAAGVLLEQGTPPNLAKGIEEFGATICFTAPTAYRAMCALLPSHDISTLRECVSAGETLPRATFEAWEERTGIRIIDGIGSTEMLHIFISASGDDIRPGATGLPVPGYEARVIDEEGRDVPDGEIGRLAVRGPTGCRYLDNLERQRAYVQDGWNITGDSYRRDADGYYWYQARTDDMIISSGYNISGPEVESILLLHPAVQECGVVGAPDTERGQVVRAFVVLRPGFTGDDALTKQLQDFVKAEIAPYKYPRSVIFTDALPRTDTGKLQRFRLRQEPA
jgi:2-aminobenzoate-CoA ligase